jgi:hypothetical protein
MQSNPLWPESTPHGHCGDCVWLFRGGRGRPVDRCRRHENRRVEADWVGCAAFTQSLECLECGACCREAYHAVEVSRRDPFRRTHAHLLTTVDGRLNIKRCGPNCINLNADGGPFTCAVYSDRPKTCRDFEQAGENCLIARKRLGLTP